MSSEKGKVVSLHTKRPVKKKKIVSFIARNSILILVIALVGYFSYNLVSPIIQREQINKDIAQVEEEIELTLLKNQELKKKIELLQTDLYVERMAREKLGFVKEGETLIMPAKQGEENKLNTTRPLY